MTPTRRAAFAAGFALLVAPRSTARGRAEALGVAVVGCGARGTQLALEVSKLGHDLVALCDIAPFRLAALSKLLPADAARLETANYRRVLDHKSVDAVVIATPDHHHKDQLLAALGADKDVYIETPLTKSLDEHADVAEAARKANRVVQVGLQRRSSAAWEESTRLARGRAFGQLVRAAAWDARNWQTRDPLAPPAGGRP